MAGNSAFFRWRNSERRAVYWWWCSTLAVLLVIIAHPQVSLRWRIYSGRQALAIGKSAVAVKELLHAAQLAPNNAETQYLLAVAQRRSGNLNRVAAPLQRAEQLGWPKGEIERQSLLIIAQSGDCSAVEARLKSIMIQGVSDGAAEEIYEALAIGYLKSYRLKEAWKCLSFWSEWQPKAIFPMIWRADICRRVNNRPGEEREYRAILAIDTNHCEARERLAEVLKGSNRVDEAKSEYERCLKVGDRTPELLIGLAECYRRLAATDSAISILQQALAMKLSASERAAVLSELGQIAADEGHTEEAIAKLEEAASLTPYEAPVLYSLSQAYAQSGNAKRSRELLEQSEEIRAKSNRVEEITGQLLKVPNDADLRCEVGQIMMDLGMKDEGANWLRTAIRIDPNHQLARDLLSAYQAKNSEK